MVIIRVKRKKLVAAIAISDQNEEYVLCREIF
jgi:hypothetical protein